MLSLSRRMSFDVEFSRVAVAVADMLQRQMDDAAFDIGRDATSDPQDPDNLTAKSASRIAVLCRWLVEEIRFYEHCDRLRRDTEDSEMPF